MQNSAYGIHERIYTRVHVYKYFYVYMLKHISCSWVELLQLLRGQVSNLRSIILRSRAADCCWSIWQS